MTSRPVSGIPISLFGPTVTLLVLLVVVDFMFIAIHALHAWSPWLSGRHYSLESANGMASIYQYIKQVWLVGCLALAFVQTRARVFAAWALLFAMLLIDDALELHERYGVIIAASLDFPAIFGLRPADLGEILVAASLGCVALSLVAIAFWRGGSEARQLSADLMCLLVALAFFGVFFDVLHTITHFNAPAIAQFFALIEDGGEKLVVSAITAYTFDLTSNSGRRRIPVWSWVRGRF
jgi:hypothetical protein